MVTEARFYSVGAYTVNNYQDIYSVSTHGMGLVGGEGREDCWGIGERVRVGSGEREGVGQGKRVVYKQGRAPLRRRAKRGKFK